MSDSERELNGVYRGRLNRLRAAVLALAILLVFAAISAPVVVITVVGRSAARSQLVVSCTVLESSARELEALNGIRRTLGLPTRIEVPPLPPECLEVLP